MYILDHDRINEKRSKIILPQSYLLWGKKWLEVSTEKVEDKMLRQKWFIICVQMKLKVKDGGC